MHPQLQNEMNEPPSTSKVQLAFISSFSGEAKSATSCVRLISLKTSIRICLIQNLDLAISDLLRVQVQLHLCQSTVVVEGQN